MYGTRDPLSLYIETKKHLLLKVKDLEWALNYDRIEEAQELLPMIQKGLEELSVLIRKVEVM